MLKIEQLKELERKELKRKEQELLEQLKLVERDERDLRAQLKQAERDLPDLRERLEQIERQKKDQGLGLVGREMREPGEEPEEREESKKERARLRIVIASICVVGFLIPYILARLFLLVEIFRTLCFLPPDAFVDTWSGSFPHIG